MPVPSSRPDIIALFAKTAGEIEGKDFSHITRETPIDDLAIDSVVMMEILGCMEDDLDIEIPDGTLAGLRTVGDIERIVLAHQ